MKKSSAPVIEKPVNSLLEESPKGEVVMQEVVLAIVVILKYLH